MSQKSSPCDFSSNPSSGAERDCAWPEEGGRRPVVLVGEDEKAVREMLGVALDHHGFSVFLAGGGEEVIQIYSRHRQAIDVVLLDVHMPDCDGPQTLAALQEIEPGVPVVFMSGNIGCYSGEELLALGAVRVLPKPFGSMAELVQLLGLLAGRA